jgi:hypothetical protein
MGGKRPCLPLGRGFVVVSGDFWGHICSPPLLCSCRAESGEKPITMNGLAVVAATTITPLARPADDPKTAAALLLDLASKIVTVLDCRIEDLL